MNYQNLLNSLLNHMEVKMSKAYESIKQGLQEAINFKKGKPIKAVIHKFTAVDVKRIRNDIGMSQMEFASSFGISLGTLRHWERGDRQPQGPALVLLNVVDREPKVVLKALSFQQKLAKK